MSKRIVSLMLIFVMSFGKYSHDITYSSENENTSNVDLVLGETTPKEDITNDKETVYSLGEASFSEDGIVSDKGGYFTVSVDFGSIQIKDDAVLNNVIPVDNLAMGGNSIQMTSSTSLAFNINTQTTYEDLENAIKSMEFVSDNDMSQKVKIDVVMGFSLEDNMSPLKTQNGKQYRYFYNQDGMTYGQSSNFATSQGGLLASPETEQEINEISNLFSEYKHLDENNVEHLSFVNTENILFVEEYTIFDQEGYAIVDGNYLEDGVIVDYEPNKFEAISAVKTVPAFKSDSMSKIAAKSPDVPYYVSNLGSDFSGTGTHTNPYATIQKAVDKARANPAVNTTDGAIIYVMGNSPSGIGGTYTMSDVADDTDYPGANDDAPKKITITSTNSGYAGQSAIPASNRVVVQRDPAFNNKTMFKVSHVGSTMIFQDIIIDGNNVHMGTSMTGAFDLLSGTMKLDNVLVNNHKVAGYNSRVFLALGSNSHFEVKDSEITNNYGDNFDDFGNPVNIDGNIFTLGTGSTLTMEDTEVTLNDVNKIVSSWNNETITIKDSEISNNYSTRNIFALANSKFTMLNTVVSNNTVDDVINISGNAEVNMKTGSQIYDNIVTGYAVTGIPNGESFKIEGNVQINNNSDGINDKNVFLPTGSTIKTTGNIGGSSIGFTPQLQPNSKTNDSVVIAEKSTSTPNYVPVQADENIFFEDVHATGLQVKWRDSTPTGDGKIYLEYIWDAGLPTITSQSLVGYTETASQHIAGNQVSVTAVTPTDEPSPINGVLSYQWYSNTTNSNVGGTVAPGVSTNATYSLPNPVGSTAGSQLYYYCEVTNTNINATRTITAKAVSNPVEIEIIPLVDAQTPVVTTTGDISTLKNSIVAINATATVSDGGSLSYQWYSCDDMAGSNPQAIPGAISSTFTPPTTTIGNYYYFVEVTNYKNVNGIDTSTAKSTIVNVNVHLAGGTGTGGNTGGGNTGSGNIDNGNINGVNIDNTNAESDLIEIAADFVPLGTAPVKSDVSRYLNTSDHFSYLIGYEDGLFRPENNMTRAEVSQMFYNLLLDKNPPTEDNVGYSDVPADAWYAEAVNTLSSKDILSGYPDGSFKPDEPITRAEFVTIVYGFAQESKGTESFADVTTEHWAYDEILMAAADGSVTGYEDGTFRPDQPITRAESVTIVNVILNRQADVNFIDETEINTFADVQQSHWAYYEIIEAIINHEYEIKDTKETWSQYE